MQQEEQGLVLLQDKQGLVLLQEEQGLVLLREEQGLVLLLDVQVRAVPARRLVGRWGLALGQQLTVEGWGGGGG